MTHLLRRTRDRTTQPTALRTPEHAPSFFVARRRGGAGFAGNCSSALQDVVDNRWGRFREAGGGTVAAARMKEN